MWEKVSQETDISGSFFKEDGAVGGQAVDGGTAFFFFFLSLLLTFALSKSVQLLTLKTINDDSKN